MPRLQFGIRTLLSLTLFAAVLCMVFPSILDRYLRMTETPYEEDLRLERMHIGACLLMENIRRTKNGLPPLKMRRPEKSPMARLMDRIERSRVR